MYQIKTDSRLEIQVTAHVCRVVDENGNERFSGNYDQCLAWIASRGIVTR